METIVNDFTFNIATANGTGSQSSNIILLQSMFEMGVPVSGKNLFPSNISGLPTWYIIRVSDEGYQAPGDRTHIQVLMNKATWDNDIASLESGTVVIYNSDVKLPVERDDLILYPIPMTTIARGLNPKLARMIANMVYVGVIAELIGLDDSILDSAVNKQFNGKAKAIELNSNAITLGREYVVEHFEQICPFALEPREQNPESFIIDGNEAVALGSLFGGVTMLSWYPITPSTSIAEAIISHLPKLRSDDDGKLTCAVIQSEDELAAAGMVVGAGWAGGRAMTCTSGPGISLMSEFVGLAYFSEVPGVIWDVNRVGPSTGLPTRTQQGDLSMLYEVGHGDTKHLVLIPGTIEECFEFAWRAFDLAERYQTIVFGFSDLDLGMNPWICSGFDYPEKMDRGKVLHTQDDIDAIENYGRYRDVDGDGICYRTLPGSGLEPILYRGTGHDEDAVYSENPEVYVANMARLKRKIDGARTVLPQPILREEPEMQVGIIYYGSMENTIQEIDDILEATGLKVSQCRLRSLPISPVVEEFVANHEQIIVLEVNRDGQLYGILRKELPIDLVPRVHSVAFSDGLPPRARKYSDMIREKLLEVMS
ncbi:MAG TPA: 2-oxoacid:acceptor oxidoreductase subunit alpha [Candidatus Poseidoniales archaeon]|nr:MAG: 2-oxoacid:acceptor oxidoreductase subunit alpha [Euryarchaeota archaeon]HHZ74184.1 2-oxoacid:acceptor oxidoreductase subunit alpha [Candidatus Poseidoniales archaeon]PXY75680.1 MAG: 2-oxoacid:acceptor oxidoreductase subunit alpha [Euryarchaeota archaeon]PXY78388.1 MAG: 2-oxoacid:acceptor oxidoreductase subunit alpha [Euryarchaeota archaeon]PXY79595.1 MAG: 2-oxoacid:acceptor oxidoreductase subunit alpha [Euryarchaeota archaeon]